MVNYPNKKKVQSYIRKIDGKHDTAHRGMNLEEDINLTNQYYLANDIAVIHKKPTPIQIVKVSSKHLQQQTTMGFIKEDILILKQKKPKHFLFLLQIFLYIKSII